MKTIDEQLACAKRELALRRNVYPKWVGKRMTQDKATHEIECMEAIIATLEYRKALIEVGDEMKKNFKP